MQTQYNDKITYICAGRSAYNNKGKKVKFYESYYIDTPDYNANLAVAGIFPDITPLK
jgi:hypothetical protein